MAEHPDIVKGRLSAVQLAENFADLHPPLDNHGASVEAARCYFCHDAPCVTACPTGIDIPLFIRQIATGYPTNAARTILDENIMGGMCARVCPTETLCEEACVRNDAEAIPVKIGLLQRHATDRLLAGNRYPYERGAESGKRVAVVGAGPAGIACAHRLALHGHGVTIFDAGAKPGGLNEYGLAAYKTIDDFAQREIALILSIGGINIESGRKLGENLDLADLRRDFDAVFLGLGLSGVNDLGLPGDDLDGVEDAVAYIARLRQSADLTDLPVGRDIVVIGGGMTAIDIATQSKLLGAETVTIAYRRGPAEMKASGYEQHVAQTRGVRIRHGLTPSALSGENGHVVGVVFDRAEGGSMEIPADMVFKAIGQRFSANGFADGLDLTGGRVAVDADRRTSLDAVWAGGDCVAGGDDLTVSAVQDGKVAAESIHRHLAGET